MGRPRRPSTSASPTSAIADLGAPVDPGAALHGHKADEADPELSAKWFYATIAAGSVGTTMTAPITALYAKALGASDGVAALVVSTMAVSFLCLDLVCSRVVPRVDARSALVGGYLVFGVGSFISAVAPTLEIMAAARLLQGFAVAFPIGAGFHMALRLASKGGEGREIARFNAYSFIGFTVGPLIVGLVADISGGTTGLRWGFAACGVVNVAGALIARFALPSIPAHDRPQFGLPGRRAFAGRRTRKALVAAGLGFGLRGVAGMTLLPLLGSHLGAGPTTVAVAAMLMAVAELGGIAMSGRLADSLGRKPVIAVSAGLTSLVLVLLMLSPTIAVYVALSAVLGFVISALRVVPTAMVVDVAESEESAAIGWRLACDVNSLGTAVLVSAVFSIAGLYGGFVYAAGASALVGLLALSIGETRIRAPAQPIVGHGVVPSSTASP